MVHLNGFSGKSVGWKKRVSIAIACALMLLAAPAQELYAMPEKLTLTLGNQTRLDMKAPLSCEVWEGAQSVSARTDDTLAGVGGVLLTAEEEGSARLVFRILGIPIRTLRVTVAPQRVLVPGGQSIGVAIKTRGVLVVGASDVGGQKSPALEAGLRSGDYILEADGTQVTDCAHLSELIRAGEARVLTVLRNGRTLHVPIAPKLDTRDGAMRLGAWVRDSTAGVGTLSFYAPETSVFAALGHAVTDEDTGKTLTVRQGEIFLSRVTNVLPGQKGEPGELTGEFFTAQNRLGEVLVNTEYGIYGASDESVENPLYPDGVGVATRDEVQLGDATLLTTLNEDGVCAYDCRITRLFEQSEPGQRGMVVEITDPDLLETTGGIVQGMSGSPLIQNGRLIGAVTHVFINDPTQGYGMYVDWMLEQADAAA